MLMLLIALAIASMVLASAHGFGDKVNK